MESVTTCTKGHEMTPENTINRADGKVRCKACEYAYRAEWRARNREKIRAYDRELCVKLKRRRAAKQAREAS